jgi:hypothetical protein
VTDQGSYQGTGSVGRACADTNTWYATILLFSAWRQLPLGAYFHSVDRHDYSARLCAASCSVVKWQCTTDLAFGIARSLPCRPPCEPCAAAQQISPTSFTDGPGPLVVPQMVLLLISVDWLVKLYVKL